MSGGVDSSVALYLLKEQGYEPVGVSLKYDVWKDPRNECRENVCCTKESFTIAKKICKQLGIKHYIVDISKEFRCQVIDYFIREYKNSRTPSPCVLCNLNVKFKALIGFADEIGAKYIATGHYARIRAVKSSKLKAESFELLRAKDKNKDQTYSLCFLNQAILSRAIFPLGELTKEEVYKIARGREGFEVFGKRKQSQDFCFVSGKSLNLMLEKEIGAKRGEIVNEGGKVLGEHKGLHFYTIGQRKGIDLAGGPYFVIEKNKNTNELVVSADAKFNARKKASIFPVRFISGSGPSEPIKVVAKLRSTAKPASAKLVQAKHGYILEFDKPQMAVTPGQIAVFYDASGGAGFSEICLGGGVIN